MRQKTHGHCSPGVVLPKIVFGHVKNVSSAIINDIAFVCIGIWENHASIYLHAHTHAHTHTHEYNNIVYDCNINCLLYTHTHTHTLAPKTMPSKCEKCDKNDLLWYCLSRLYPYSFHTAHTHLRFTTCMLYLKEECKICKTSVCMRERRNGA